MVYSAGKRCLALNDFRKMKKKKKASRAKIDQVTLQKLLLSLPYHRFAVDSSVTSTLSCAHMTQLFF